MQQYPYLQEMKERLLRHNRETSLSNNDSSEMTTLPGDLAEATEKDVLEVQDTPVGTVVKLNPDGYGSHTSPAHKPFRYHDAEAFVHYYPKNAKTSLFIITSALYAKLVVVICIAYVISEVVTHNVPLHYYEGFFTYLYGASILFLLYVFCYLLQESSRKGCKKKKDKKSNKSNIFQSMLRNIRKNGKDVNLNDGGSPTQEKLASSDHKPKKSKTSENEFSHGSFFLRIGAIEVAATAFGLGTMIYNGLEFGAFFEIPFDSPCYQILRGVNPLLQMVFTFMQMYFIFMNSRLNIHKFKVIARFGLMHVVATNICVWIRTLVRESLKEITDYRLRHGEGVSEDFMILAPVLPTFAPSLIPNSSMSPINPSTWDLVTNYTCGRVNIMGTIVTDSAPYLYPFIIEYSLIGAAVVYVIWAHIGRNPRYIDDEDNGLLSRRPATRVDCIGASKGLFFGLLLLVASLICLILFFVLVTHKELSLLAIYLADASHCVVMVLSLMAMLIGFFRIQSLKFHSEHRNPLGDLLLRISAFGLFVYAVFSVIAGTLAAFTHEPNLLVMVTGILSVVQVVIQMLFIADVSRRRVHLPEHDRTKPGRQVVTFLLICNLTMWIIYTFEMQKVEANPVQLDFYGFMAWALVQRLTLPLCIFHRFHSSVTFAEIWKNSYKSRIE